MFLNVDTSKTHKINLYSIDLFKMTCYLISKYSLNLTLFSYKIKILNSNSIFIQQLTETK